MLGLVYGDALSRPIEFVSSGQIVKGYAEVTVMTG